MLKSCRNSTLVKYAFGYNESDGQWFLRGKNVLAVTNIKGVTNAV